VRISWGSPPGHLGGLDSPSGLASALSYPPHGRHARPCSTSKARPCSTCVTRAAPRQTRPCDRGTQQTSGERWPACDLRATIRNPLVVNALQASQELGRDWIPLGSAGVRWIPWPVAKVWRIGSEPRITLREFRRRAATAHRGQLADPYDRHRRSPAPHRSPGPTGRLQTAAHQNRCRVRLKPGAAIPDTADSHSPRT
jgi:hypothetical protein